MPGHFVPDPAALNQMLNQPGGVVYPFLNRFGKDVERRARAKALKDRGNLKRSVYSRRPNYGAAGLSLQVGATDHAAMVIHQGHKRINVPPMGTSSYMKFQPKDLRGSKNFVRTNTVRAVAGYPFITAALKEANASLFGGAVFKITILRQPRRGQGPKGAPSL